MNSSGVQAGEGGGEWGVRKRCADGKECHRTRLIVKAVAGASAKMNNSSLEASMVKLIEGSGVVSSSQQYFSSRGFMGKYIVYLLSGVSEGISAM